MSNQSFFMFLLGSMVASSLILLWPKILPWPEEDLHVEDVVDMLYSNQYLSVETYPDPDLPNDIRIGTRILAVLYYEGPSKADPTRDTLIDLHIFNSHDYLGASDITEVWYMID